MRVGRFGIARLHDDDQGAVLAIVAITLLVLLGMLVLTFDLGRGVAIKRNAVSAADSSALAAAMECGLGNGDVSARQAADELTEQNNADATVTGFELDPAECNGVASDGENTVTVTVSAPQDYVFAPIFGFDNGTVVASATAEWTMGVPNPVPLKLDMLDVEGCNDGHQPGYSGPECYFTFEKSGTGSQRGWLDFPQGWPVQGQDPNPLDCSSQAGGVNELRGYIEKMGLGQSTNFSPLLWNPPPTYVCAAGGVPNDLVQAMQQWLLAVADMDPKPAVFFPVAACDGQAPPCYPWITTSGREAYPVVDFVGMRIVDAWSGNSNRWPSDAQDNCQFERRSSDVFCIHLEVSSPDDPVLNADPVVRLID
jgi:Flp pilus assembly protein TadG